MRLLAVVISAIFLHLNVTAGEAQAAGIRRDTPSGFPVPRFVSLKDDETNCRIGPSFDHPVRFVFKRAGAPVMVVAESVDHWRRVRDLSGDECWAHQTTLEAQSHVLTLGETELFRRPDEDAEVSGRLGGGVLARIAKRKDGWLLVSVGEARGWTRVSKVWGGEIAASDPAGRN